jgi:methionine-rich copper-binding protein CopC
MVERGSLHSEQKNRKTMTCSNENQQRNAGKMRVVWRIEKRKGHATPGLMLILASSISSL